MTDADKFVVRMRNDRLAPDIQAGDHLVVRLAETADQGALAVVADEDNNASVQRYSEGRVVGVVTDMWRLIP